MTDNVMENIWQSERVTQRMRKRKREEARFKAIGFSALVFAATILAVLFVSIFIKGVGAFSKTEILVPVHFDSSTFAADKLSDLETDFYKPVKVGFASMFSEVTEISDRKKLLKLISQSSEDSVREYLKLHPDAVGQTRDVWVTSSSLTDLYMKNKISLAVPEAERRLSDRQVEWIEKLKGEKKIRSALNTNFFGFADSRQPEYAGIAGAFIGSLMTVLMCMLASLPIGILTAICLQEFAKNSKIASLVELNINNLAAVPSIIFGLLGLVAYIQIFGIPRSSALAGGLTLSMMILPTIIIATRAAMAAIPDSIRDAARAMGASELQVVFHHVLPLSIPGIMTGVILGIARALGETAPLIMIGMVAFIVDVPAGILEPATTMPVQIFLWADNPLPAFAEKTAGAIIVLLTLLIALNSLAVYIRRRFERRW